MVRYVVRYRSVNVVGVTARTYQVQIRAVEGRMNYCSCPDFAANRLEDLYSVMQVIDERILGPLWQYLIDFHITDERGKVIGYRNFSELRRRLAPVMLRRDRRLVRDQLPSRINHRLDVPLSKKQREIHDGALSMAAQLAAIMKKRPLTPSEEHRLMAALQKARMACDAEGLIDKKTEGSAKLNELSVGLGAADRQGASILCKEKPGPRKYCCGRDCTAKALHCSWKPCLRLRR